MTTKFLKWWLIFTIQSITLGVIIYFGGLNYLLDNDRTYLSIAICCIWLYQSIITGVSIYKSKEATELSWFLADSCMTIGMVGTVVGFIIMLSTSFADIDVTNVTAMKIVISNMATGMGTALLTTLSGLVASIYLKLQLVHHEAE